MFLGDLIKIGSFRVYGFTLLIIAMFIFNIFYWKHFVKKNEIKPLYTLKIKEKEFHFHIYMILVPLISLAIYGMSKYVLHNPGVNTLNIFGLNISWYALCVMSGALVTYYVSRWLAKKERGLPEVIDNLFIPAFAAGIICARLWYVVSEWEYYMANPNEILAIWNGGLAIQGGVVGGALVGIFYIKKRYPTENVLTWVDLIVPNILIAQSIGRWGNFFNQEVYGDYILESKVKFLPSFILENLKLPSCYEGEVVVPLFLIEAILNCIIFVIITIVIRKYWKNRKPGSLGCLYLIYYGIVRIIMEPLRQEEYIMRIFGNLSQSMLMSLLFIISGIVLILFLNLRKKKVNDNA